MSTTQSLSLKEDAVVEKVKTIAEPLCEAEGLELIFVEYQRESSGKVLRLYIDNSEGVKLDDCVRVSRQLGDLLDVYLGDIGPYHLEVTSPGPDRPIGKIEDYERFKGCRAKIKTLHPIEGRKNFSGILKGLSDERINLMVDERTVAIPLKEIQKARLINFHGEIPCSSQT
ncbi:MAG: ribosome maturation factor RimP [Deltaproteobacteria bacterium]|nr:ribosome maturation factor RimP [Deltaproteobacteria bacterium]MBW1959863.1 ribosome maturation factor RimP [Deltaproteobacteria bacterium]MBW1993365.1 ribosome maturation factor RimP [Deltaproteobacteria bacterium]MBW2150377.1 ribosome maturation factor RimP [Deltaproteobacteria bacterium]